MEDKKKSKTSSILPGLLGGGIFLIFTFILKFHILISLLLGIAGFAAGILLFSRKKKEIDIIADGITREQYNEVLAEGQEKLKTLTTFITRVENVAVKKKIKEITDVVEKIFLDLKKDPRDIRPARQFLSYYLDTTLKILEQYTEISRQKIRSAKIRKTLSRVEELLDTIKLAFEKQLEKLLRDDILDLDSELKVLEQTIKTEMLEGEQYE